MLKELVVNVSIFFENLELVVKTYSMYCITILVTQIWQNNLKSSFVDS